MDSMAFVIGLVEALSISSPVPQKEKKEKSWEAFDKQLKTLYELKSHETGAQGNCQFCVLSFVLNQYQVYTNHTCVRQEVCDEMINNSHLYREFVSTNGEDAGMPYTAFVEQLRADGEWGGHVTGLPSECKSNVRTTRPKVYQYVTVQARLYCLFARDTLSCNASC